VREGGKMETSKVAQGEAYVDITTEECKCCKPACSRHLSTPNRLVNEQLCSHECVALIVLISADSQKLSQLCVTRPRV
jgi:hypothetical protein